MKPLLASPGLACGWIPGRFGFPGHSLTLIAKGTFDLVPGGPARPAEEPLELQGDVHHDDDPTASLRYESDFAWWKPRADCLLVGHCWVPEGRPRSACDVRFRAGPVDATLRVTGERRWGLPWAPLSPVLGPEPFARMPLRFERAAGGPRDRRNPVGRGRRFEEDAEGRPFRPLPNLEHPGTRWRSPWRRPRPAGFGPVHRTWKPRSRRLGTYRRKWRKQRFPWLPDDFDWSHFNAAPPELRAPGYLRGDEDLRLEHLHPEHPVLDARLPGLRARCFLREEPDARGEDEPELREVRLELDTLWIDADALKLVLVWRGVTGVRSPDFDDELAHALFFHEPLDAPQDAAEVAELFARARAADETEPEAPEEPGPDPEQQAAWRAELASGWEEVAELLAAEGLPRDLLDRPRSREEGIAAARASLRESYASRGLDPSLADAWQPPPAAPEGALEAFAERHGLTLPADEGPAPALDREAVAARAAAGESLEGEDLSGLDLSGLALGGAKLAGATLRATRLAGAGLEGADLTGALLEGADLGQARLDGARLGGADLTGASLAGASLRGADLGEALLERAVLEGADLGEATGAGAVLVEAVLAGASLEGASLPGADFSDARLDGLRAAGASLPEATLEGASGADVDLSGADLGSLRASGARLDGVRLAGANAEGSVWDGASLAGAVLAGAVLKDAELGGAQLAGADLTRCDAPGARFRAADLRGAVLREANLFRGSLERADCRDADLRGASCFEVEVLDAERDGAATGGANLRRTKWGRA